MARTKRGRRDWGKFERLRDLPNVNRHIFITTELEVGDVAAVGGLMYKCTDATQGEAVWVRSDSGSGGSVDSFEGRTGVVTAQAGDYAASEVTNDSGVAGANTDDALNQLDADIAALDATLDAHVANTSNPHSTTDENLGLSGQIGSPGVDTLVEHMNRQNSPGVYSGGGITDDGDGTVTVAAGAGLIRASDSDTAALLSFEWPATPITPTDADITYIYVEYNAGSPQVVGTTTARTDVNTNLLLGTVQRSGTFLHITNRPISLVARPREMHERMVEQHGLTRTSGAIVAETGTRQLTVTAATLWLGLNRIVSLTGGFDSSGADTFFAFYRDGVGGWTVQTSQTTVSNSLYDDNSGTLANLTGSRRGVYWIYVGIDDHVYLVYGRGNYTNSQAQDAQPPSDLPPHIQESHAVLAAKIIVQRNATNFQSVESAFDIAFHGVGATDHGDLSGNADDDHSQYSLADGSRGVALDGTWRAQNTADPTKQMALDVSGVTAGQTRTFDVPDHDGTLTEARYVRETGGPTVLTMGGVADGEYLRRSGTSIIGGTPGGFNTESVEGFVADAGTAANRRGYTIADPFATTGDFSFSTLYERRSSDFVSGDAQVFGTRDATVSGGGGIGIVIDSGNIGLEVVDNGGALRIANSFLADATTKLVFAVVTVDNNGTSLVVTLFINGAQRNEYFDAGGGGTLTAGGDLCVGLIDGGAVAPAANIRWMGGGYLNGTVLSDLAVANWTKDIQQAGQFVDDPGTGLTAGWRIDGDPGSSDLSAFVGTGTLTNLNSTALTYTDEDPPQVWY